MKNPVHSYLVYLLQSTINSSRRYFTETDNIGYFIEQSNNAEHQAIFLTLEQPNQTMINLFPGYHLINEHLTVEPETNEQHPDPFHYTARFKNETQDIITIHIFYNSRGQISRHHVIDESNDHDTKVAVPVKPMKYLTIDEKALSRIKQRAIPYHALLQSLFKERYQNFMQQLSELNERGEEFEEIIKDIMLSDKSQQISAFQAHYVTLENLAKEIQAKGDEIHQRHGKKYKTSSDAFFNLLNQLSNMLFVADDASAHSDEPDATISAELEEKLHDSSSSALTRSSHFTVNRKCRTNLTIPKKIENLLVEIDKRQQKIQQYLQAMQAGNLVDIINLQDEVSQFAEYTKLMELFWISMLATLDKPALSEKMVAIGHYLYQTNSEHYMMRMKIYLMSLHPLKFAHSELIVGPLFLAILNKNVSALEMLLEQGADPNQEISYYLSSSAHPLKFQLFPLVEVFLMSVCYGQADAVRVIQKLLEYGAKMSSSPEEVNNIRKLSLNYDTTKKMVVSRVEKRNYKLSISKKDAGVLDSNELDLFIHNLDTYRTREETYFIYLLQAHQVTQTTFQRSMAQLKISKEIIKATSKANNGVLIYLKECLLSSSRLDFEASSRLLTKIVESFEMLTGEFMHQAALTRAGSALFYCFDTQKELNAKGEEFTFIENQSYQFSYLFYHSNTTLSQFMQGMLTHVQTEFLKLAPEQQREMILTLNTPKTGWLGILCIHFIEDRTLSDYQTMLKLAVTMNDKQTTAWLIPTIHQLPIELKNILKQEEDYKALIHSLIPVTMNAFVQIKSAFLQMKTRVQDILNTSQDKQLLFCEEMNQIKMALMQVNLILDSKAKLEEQLFKSIKEIAELFTHDSRDEKFKKTQYSIHLAMLSLAISFDLKIPLFPELVAMIKGNRALITSSARLVGNSPSGAPSQPSKVADALDGAHTPN